MKELPDAVILLGVSKDDMDYNQKQQLQGFLLQV